MRAILISGASLAAVVILAAGMTVHDHDEVEPVALVEQETPPASPVSDGYDVGSSGAALATAAFGLSALQPETYNGQIVIDIIEASPLDFGEKDRLIAKLMAAEAGRAELPRVLADIRLSLAVE